MLFGPERIVNCLIMLPTKLTTVNIIQVLAKIDLQKAIHCN
jgi:hypothetical protein